MPVSKIYKVHQLHCLQSVCFDIDQNSKDDLLENLVAHIRRKHQLVSIDPQLNLHLELQYSHCFRK